MNILLPNEFIAEKHNSLWSWHTCFLINFFQWETILKRSIMCWNNRKLIKVYAYRFPFSATLSMWETLNKPAAILLWRCSTVALQTLRGLVQLTADNQ